MLGTAFESQFHVFAGLKKADPLLTRHHSSDGQDLVATFEFWAYNKHFRELRGNVS